jgi:TIR domain
MKSSDRTGKTPTEYDVFLCHNSKDKTEIKRIGEQLIARGLRPWLDEWDLRPGFDWMDEIEETVQVVHAVAVFVGPNQVGAWQRKEIKAYLRRQVDKELPVIPVVLSGCESEPELPEFLKDFTWVDFRKSDPDPLERLYWGITGQKPSQTPKPTVLVAPATADLRKHRNQLVQYCQNSGLRVLERFPEAPETLKSEFLAALERCDFFVQLLSGYYSDRTEEFPEGKERWFFEAAQKRRPPVRLVQWLVEEAVLDDVDDQEHLAFVKCPEVLTGKTADLHQLVLERAQRAFRDGPLPDSSQGPRLAMVKYRQVDAPATRSLVDVLTKANIGCQSSLNGTPLLDRLRDVPFDVLIVVLGEAPDEWLEARGDELAAVVLALKDQAPLRAYYHASDPETKPDRKAAEIIPPFVGPGILEIRGPNELNRLIDVIQGRGGAR